MTPHGAMIAGTAFGKMPFVLDRISLEAVGVEDAARAMILAADRGRVGERYLISERMISNRGRGAASPPMRSAYRCRERTVPVPVLYAMGALGSVKARLRGSDEQLTPRSRSG